MMSEPTEMANKTDSRRETSLPVLANKGASSGGGTVRDRQMRRQWAPGE